MRTTLVIALLVAVATGCGSAPGEVKSQPSCPPPVAPDTGTAAGWIGWIAQHPGDVSLLIDDGRGEQLAHRDAEPAPTASASKVLHLASYARGVAEGRLNPDEPVSVGDWEAWYLPGTDGGAHPAALDSLEVAHDGVRALDPQRTVRLDDMVATMIQVSDNAVPDYLRQRLGDDALRRAGAEAGRTPSYLPSSAR